MSKFSLYTDKHNQFRWRFIASNEHVIARSSEGYARKEECLESLKLLQKEIVGAVVDPQVHALVPQKAAGETAVAPSPVVAADSKPAGASPAVVAAPHVAVTK